MDAAERKEILSRYLTHSRRFEEVAARRRGAGGADVIPLQSPLRELEQEPTVREIEPPLVDYGNGHLAACHHPLNVDQATLQQVGVAEQHTPAAADETALPQDTSGRSNPAVTPTRDTRSS